MKPFSHVHGGDIITDCLAEQEDDANECQVMHASGNGEMGDCVEATSVWKQEIVIPTGGKILLCNSQSRPDVYIFWHN